MVLFLAKARVSRRQYAESSSTHDTVVIPIKRTLVRALGINAVDHQPAKMMRSQSPKASCFSSPDPTNGAPASRLWVNAFAGSTDDPRAWSGDTPAAANR